MHFSERKIQIQPSKSDAKRTLQVQITETSVLHLRASCLETGRVTNPLINTNLYILPRIIQNNMSTTAAFLYYFFSQLELK